MENGFEIDGPAGGARGCTQAEQRTPQSTGISQRLKPSLIKPDPLPIIGRVHPERHVPPAWGLRSGENEVMKPLFVPLKTEYYRDFECGMKTTEYRLYGPRWNERTCQPGRAVVLSRGYGKRDRLRGTVAGFIAEPLACLPSDVYRELRALYPRSEWSTKIACIGIELD